MNNTAVPIVSPTTEVEAESPIWWNVEAADRLCVLGDHLLRVRTEEEVDVELSTRGPVDKARGRRKGHLVDLIPFLFFDIGPTSWALLLRKRTP